MFEKIYLGQKSPFGNKLKVTSCSPLFKASDPGQSEAVVHNQQSFSRTEPD